MDVRQVKVEGKVESRVVAPGSKSEHTAPVLTTTTGETYVLRRKGGPAFADPGLAALHGRSIAAEGFATDGTLIMERWQTVDDKPGKG